jgi:glycerol-3-phosphate dehydrogenase
MVAIANGTASAATVSLLQTNAAASASSGSATRTAGTNAPASSSSAADIVELSDHAKATIEKAKADQAAAANLALSPDEILAKRTDALTKTLTDAFNGMNVNLDDAVRLQVDKFGNVTTEGPGRKRSSNFSRTIPNSPRN